MHFIKKIIFQHRYKKAVHKAIELADKTGMKHFVITLKGKPIAISKRYVTHMVRTGKFKKGTRVSDIEKMALFVTPPKQKRHVHH